MTIKELKAKIEEAKTELEVLEHSPYYRNHIISQMNPIAAKLASYDYVLDLINGEA